MAINAFPTSDTEIDNSLDRQNLTVLRKRFMQINGDRLHRLDMALNYNQTTFLKTLPLLFHCNHPMLPGFVSHSTPCGVCEYKPNKSEISHAKSLARSFRLTGGYHGENIWGIYLMGSVGTLAQSHKSDLDVWLCYRPGLAKEQLQELQQKCERISRWAANQRLEVHFFLMNSEAFKHGQQLELDEESSGSAQRLLLLDEFYRTAIFIAGRLPLWWFCPTQNESQYQEHCNELLDKRFLRPETTLDFGSVGQVPDGEFIGAGIWQLYKAIGSPYKSALKLLLMEAYVHDYPNIQPLSLEYKKAIYAGELSVNDLDPYVMIYRKIEQYLQTTGDTERLEFARRCFYFKVNKPLSRSPTNRNKSWQRLMLEKLVAEWGWTDEYLQMLDQRRTWKTMQVKEERSQLVNALNHSYDMLMEFAQRSGSERAISNEELHVLGRKLQAAFGRRPDKIEWANPGISSDITESILTFVQAKTIDNDAQQEKWVWQLYGEESGLDTPLRQTDSPVQLLLWCYRNQVAEGHFRIDIKQAPSLSESQLRRCYNRLQAWLPNPTASGQHEDFKRPAAPTDALLLINVGAETLSPYGSDVHRLSDNSDPFQYGALNENLIASIDLVVRNSWHEITCQRFTGKTAILQALNQFAALCMPGSYQAPPILEVECLGSTHAALITQRVRQWFHEITSCYYSGTKPPSTRYIFNMGGRFHSLQFVGPKLTILDHANIEKLQQYLGEPQKRYSPIVIDSHCLHNHPLKVIAKNSSAKAINVYYHKNSSVVTAWIIDEKGSLARLKMDYGKTFNSLTALHRFIRATLKRLEHNQKSPGPRYGEFAIDFRELHVDQNRKIRISPRVALEQIQDEEFFLKAKMASTSEGRAQYDFSIAEQHFTWEQLDQDVFYAVAEFVIRVRQTQPRYPIFIADLELENSPNQPDKATPRQLTHYLLEKLEIERMLNRAIAQLG